MGQGKCVNLDFFLHYEMIRLCINCKYSIAPTLPKHGVCAKTCRKLREDVHMLSTAIPRCNGLGTLTC